MSSSSQPSAAFPRARAADITCFRWLGAGRADRPLLLAIATGISHWSWVPLAAILALVALLRKEGAAPVALALVTATLLQVLVKRLARRLSARRPFAMGLCDNHLDHSDRGGMPSTHAAVMACLAGAMAPWMGVWPELALIPWIAVITAWARVHAGAHFPSDVAVGLLLGTTVGIVSAQALA